MNLYDAYMTSCDRAACPPEVREVMAAAAPTPPGRECDTPYPSLAMVYAPKQSFRMTYSPEEALGRGTLFRELDKPLEVGGGRK